VLGFILPYGLLFIVRINVKCFFAIYFVFVFMFSSLSVSRAIFVIACIQFVNIVDFMMVMPLGPDFVTHLSIASNQIGWISGSYTLAAAIAGIVFSPLLDKWQRKRMVIISSFCLAITTLLTAFVWDMASLMFMRLFAGVFGGLATSVSMAMVIDMVPAPQRGKAIATVMSAFSIASIVGVPIGLELALRVQWNAPFVVVGLLGLVVSFLAMVLLPNSTIKNTKQSAVSFKALMSNKVVVYGYLMIAVVMFAGFLIIPFITNYFVFNLNFPRQEIGLVYLVGGIASLVTIQLTGRWVDKYGAMTFSILGTVILLFVLLFGFYFAPPFLSVYLMFTLFMVGMNMRGITNKIVLSKIPKPEIRAGYMSMQNAVQHIATTLAAICGSLMMMEGAEGQLVGMTSVVILALVVSVLQPFLILSIKKSKLSYEFIK
jgi:predicted MFS family arabinose efflux permease